MQCHSSSETISTLNLQSLRSNQLEKEEDLRCPSLGDVLTARPQGLAESEAWAVLCQAVQALQDVLLSDDGVSSLYRTIPLITPKHLLISEKGRVRLQPVLRTYDGLNEEPPPHLSRYLAPEYRHNKKSSDTEVEKMWIYGLGETMKRATLTSHQATSRLSVELCQTLTDMTRFPSHSRASLMHLLNTISDYCKTRQQTKPFSHIVMDLHQEALAGMETRMEVPWGPPSMPELEPRVTKRIENVDVPRHLPRRWMKFSKKKITREASTSMENLSQCENFNVPGSILRPKSVCVPDYLFSNRKNCEKKSSEEEDAAKTRFKFCTCDPPCKVFCMQNWRRSKKSKSSKYTLDAVAETVKDFHFSSSGENFSGPEFMLKSCMPSKKYVLPDNKGHCTKTVSVVLLDGQKLEILCNPNNSTIGNLFELIIQKEHIEDNFMLGLSVSMEGDYVFLPSDTKISKAPHHESSENSNHANTFYLRIRFFLPSLRGIKSSPARHLLYLQLRRSILEDQLPCTFSQLVNLEGLALQAEFGDYKVEKHGSTKYIPLEHYVPISMLPKGDHFRGELIKSHKKNVGLSQEKAEDEFISCCQKLGNYGGHFYKATWMLKGSKNKDVWLFICAQGISLYERGLSLARKGYNLYESFEWKNIQTLCYSKRYLCILPHENLMHSYGCKKYKLKMDNKKSYFTFRLASLHHQFFLRLRTQYTSLQSLSQQFGIPLKDAKNESNSLYKLNMISSSQKLDEEDRDDISGSVNASGEFNMEEYKNPDFDYITPIKNQVNKCKRSQSVNDFSSVKTSKYFKDDDYLKDQFDKPLSPTNLDCSTLDNKWYAKLDSRRRGVKMGTRAINNSGISVSLEAVNALEDNNGYLTPLSHRSTKHFDAEKPCGADIRKICDGAFIIDSTQANNSFYPDLQETLSESLMEKLNEISFVEERALSTATVYRDKNGSLGIRITEGSDGNVYIQSIIVGSSAYFTGKICAGDQIISINGTNIQGLKYNDALEILKSTGEKNDFIISRAIPKYSSNLTKPHNNYDENKFASLQNLKFLTNYFENLDNCIQDKKLDNKNFDYFNFKDIESKYKSCDDVSYHKHIRYNFNFENNLPDNKIAEETNKRALHQQLSLPDVPENGEVPPKSYNSLDRSLLLRLKLDKIDKGNLPPVAVPRSLGLGRKWKGPVRYPVTPIKKIIDEDISPQNFL